MGGIPACPEASAHEGDDASAIFQIDVSVNAPMTGKITKFLVEEDSTVTVGQDLLEMEPGEDSGEASSAGGADAAPAAKKEDPPAKDDTQPESSLTDKAEPKKEDGNKMAEAPKPASEPKKQEKKEVKKDEGKKQETSKEEVEQKAKGSRNETRVSCLCLGVQGQCSFLHSPTPALPQVKMSRMRQTIAKRLKQSQESAASLTTFNEIDMSSLQEFRSLYKDGVLKTQGVKLGFMSAFARAACLALREIPAANASIEGDTIVYRDYVDLSVAVATEKGLVTPVVRNADGMGLVEIEQAIAGLGKKARDNKLGLEDMSGGSFTMWVVEGWSACWAALTIVIRVQLQRRCLWLIVWHSDVCILPPPLT